MPIELEKLASRLNPSKTILFFGAGSSIPSGLPGGEQLKNQLCKNFELNNSYDLAEASQIVEDDHSRRELIDFLRKLLGGRRAIGGVLNLPNYDWPSLFTTNFDDIIEQTYQKVRKPLHVTDSNFDFGSDRDDNSARLFKVHGTLKKDVVDGQNSRIIITESDYELSEEYRQMLWTRLRADLAENDCVIIGYSLADPHVRKLISDVSAQKSDAYHKTKVYVLSYDRDETRAKLLERKGPQVSFGGIDDFFAELAKRDDIEHANPSDVGELFENVPQLNPATTPVSDAILKPTSPDRMYQGWPATLADVEKGLTFDRDQSATGAALLATETYQFITFVGASGTGKTTAARQALVSLTKEGWTAWEHSSARELLVKEWRDVSRLLSENGRKGVLFIDDAHDHLHQINKLVDQLEQDGNSSLKLILASPRHDWNPRVKSSNLFRYGKEYILRHFLIRKLISL